MYDYIITGGLGFIGKYFVKKALEENKKVFLIDKRTSVSDRTFEKEFRKNKNCNILISPIEELSDLPLSKVIVNFAAQSHVDDSIENAKETVDSNYNAVFNILNILKNKNPNDRALFVQISTDEVYGDSEFNSFNESSLLNPSNPYSATKAGADCLIKAFGRTYEMEYIITRSCNNFGAFQNHPGKLIPKAMQCAKMSEKFSVHGTGEYIRCWINVEDNVDAIYMLINDYLSNKQKYENHRIFNISGSIYKSNLEVLSMIEEAIGLPILKEFVENRPGQDIRYSIDNSRFMSFFPNYKEKKTMNLITLKEIYKKEFGEDDI